MTKSAFVDLGALGKLLIVVGAVTALLGGLVWLIGRGVISRLPGDVSFQWGNVRFFFPLATSIVLSILITVILNVVARR